MFLDSEDWDASLGKKHVISLHIVIFISFLNFIMFLVYGITNSSFMICKSCNDMTSGDVPDTTQGCTEDRGGAERHGQERLAFRSRVDDPLGRERRVQGVVEEHDPNGVGPLHRCALIVREARVAGEADRLVERGGGAHIGDRQVDEDVPGHDPLPLVVDPVLHFCGRGGY